MAKKLSMKKRNEIFRLQQLLDLANNAEIQEIAKEMQDRIRIHGWADLDPRCYDTVAVLHTLGYNMDLGGLKAHIDALKKL